MKDIERYFWIFVVGIIGGLCLYFYGEMKSYQKRYIVENRYYYKDTTYYKNTITVLPSKIIRDTLTIFTDTTDLLNRYNQLYAKFSETAIYKDTINDSTRNIYSNIEITKNRLQSKSITVSELVKSPPIQDNKSVDNHVNKNFFVGGFVTGNSHNFGFGLSGTLQMKKQTYGIGYDFINKNVILQWQRNIKR
jgi:hypothetical protein